MADTPGKYQGRDENEDELIDRVTKKKIPKGRPPHTAIGGTRPNMKGSMKGSLDRS